MSVLQHQNIRFVPSIHQRMAFAEEVRRAALEFRPEVIAVEFPDSLSSWIVRGVLRLPQISAVCMPGRREGRLETIPIDPCDSLIEAVRLGMEEEIPIEWIDVESEDETYRDADLPDDLMIETVGLEKYVETVLPFLDAKGTSLRREAAMARRLRELDAAGKRTLCVLGIAHFAAVLRRLNDAEIDSGVEGTEPQSSPRGPDEAFLTHLSPSSVVEVLREIPQMAARREMMREELGAGEGRPFEKLLALREMLKEAEEEYTERYRTSITLTQLKGLYQFMRNLSIAQGRLGPDFYTLVMSAKGTVDGDYGYEVFDLARRYDFQEKESGLPRLKIQDGVGRVEGRDEEVEIDSRFGPPATEKVAVQFRRRPTPEMREMWKEQWDDLSLFGICSWPPEDETQEKFMDFLRKRALAVLSKDRRQVVEFTTSLHDGLDIRETLRNWHTGKLFVHKTPQPQGRVGAVVVIFEDEALDDRFTWRCTLYAENNNESDISFYATPLGQEVVGPRIARTEFGGLLSVYPASHIPDIWSFPGVEQLGTCSEALLAAGILFSEDRYVAYVAARPPGSRMKELAAQYDRHIIYMPLTGFPPSQLKRIRKFHILNGHDVRKYAADYIFED